MFVRRWSFTVVEHDPDRQWIVISQRRDTIDLDDGESFNDWAARHYPDDRITVELDPWSDWPQTRSKPEH
jgi:hypothetical protein